MIYRIFNNNKIVSTVYTIPAIARYLAENMENSRGTGVRTIKSKMVNGIFNKGTYRVVAINGTDLIRKRVIPKDIRNIRIVRDNLNVVAMKWGKSKNLNNSNYNDIAKMITEQIKKKGKNFLLTHKISVVFTSKNYQNIQYVFGTKFLNFNALYDDIITKFLDLLREYEGDDINIIKIVIRYTAVPRLNEVYIYKGFEKDENEIMDDIINRMIIENKDILLKMLNKFYIWSPSTNKNCCINACFMAKYKKRDIKNHIKQFMVKYNKNKELVYNLETLCPLLKVYLKVNIKVICIDSDIEKYEYEYEKTNDTINILVKGGHTYALIPKKDFVDNYEKPNKKLDEQQLIKI